MPDENEKKYCVMLKTPDVEIIVILPMSDEIHEMINKSVRFGWIFGRGGIQITVEKDLLENFSIELMQ